MFPTPDEIKNEVAIELQYMIKKGHMHGEIDIEINKVKLIVVVRDGILDHAKVLYHPKGIRPKINLR